MPDKRPPCTSDCLRCWRNRLKHGNPETKRWLKKHGLNTLAITGLKEPTPAGRSRRGWWSAGNTGHRWLQRM